MDADGDQSSALIHTILTGIGGMGLASAGQIRVGAPFQIRVFPDCDHVEMSVIASDTDANIARPN